MRKELKVSFLLLGILISLVSFEFTAVYAAPDVFDSHPTDYTIYGGLAVSSPTAAYDLDNTTCARFDYHDVDLGGFEVKSFTTPYFNYSIINVEFKMNFSAESHTQADYQISYYVAPSPTKTVLLAWTGAAHAVGVEVWAAPTEPNDGTWSWIDISNIRFVVETRMTGGGGASYFEEYEAWVTVTTGPKPTTTLYVQPPSVIDYTLSPQPTKTIRPNADSAYGYTGWTGNYTDWDEAVQNGDTDYVSATSTGLMESSQLEDITPHPDWTIARIRVVAYARTDIATDEELVFMLVIGGVEYWADYPAWPKPGYTLTTTYEKYSWEWGKNPATGDYWTWSDIDNLEAGIESKVSDDYVWTGEIRVTQLYVEIEGPRLTVDVEVSNVENLWGYTLILSYDTTILTGTSYTTYAPFTFPWPSEINDELGYVSVSYSKEMGEPGENTTIPTFTIPLVQIAFLVEGLGSTDLDLHDTKLTTSAAKYISHVTADGYFRNTLRGDIDGDGYVGSADFSILAGAYGSSEGQPTFDARADIDGDGYVGSADFSILAGEYGQSV